MDLDTVKEIIEWMIQVHVSLGKLRIITFGQGFSEERVIESMYFRFFWPREDRDEVDYIAYGFEIW